MIDKDSADVVHNIYDMKFSIIQDVDIKLLNHMIDEYRYMTGKNDPYIFMNSTTMKILCNSVIGDNDDVLASIKKISEHVSGDNYYRGYRIFENNKLKIGEIEIR